MGGASQGASSRRLTSSRVAPTTRIESETGIQAMKPGSVVVSAGKNA
jgi:hypothetical protein